MHTESWLLNLSGRDHGETKFRWDFLTTSNHLVLQEPALWSSLCSYLRCELNDLIKCPAVNFYHKNRIFLSAD
jgi:hypothetical protein